MYSIDYCAGEIPPPGKIPRVISPITTSAEKSGMVALSITRSASADKRSKSNPNSANNSPKIVDSPVGPKDSNLFKRIKSQESMDEEKAPLLGGKG